MASFRLYAHRHDRAPTAAEADLRRRTHIKRDDIRPQVLHQTETAVLGRLDSVFLAGWNDLDLVAGVSFRVLLGAFLLERLACLLGHVLSRRFVGHGAPSLGARLTPRFDDTPHTCR